MGNGEVKGGELGEPSLIGTKWAEKEPGKIQGERKDEGGKKSTRNRIGRRVSKQRENPPKNSGGSKRGLGGGEADDDR